MPYRDMNRQVTVTVGQVYTRMFGMRIPISECILVACAREFLKCPSMDIRKSKYYRFLYRQLQEHGVVFNWYRSEQDILDRATVYRDLVYDIRDGKPAPCQEVVIIDGKPYGKMFAIEAENGYDLQDGHHRISAMIALGQTKFTLDLLEET